MAGHSCATTKACALIVQKITWFAPVQSSRASNLVFPSGRATLYARVSDHYGAVSTLYSGTVEVRDTTTRRAFAQADWDAAFIAVGEALLLGNNQDLNKLASAISLEAHSQLKASSLPLHNLTQVLSQVVAALDKSLLASPATVTSNSACEIAGVLSFVTAPAPAGLVPATTLLTNQTGSSTMDSATLAAVMKIIRVLLQSPGVTSITKDCAVQFQTVFSDVLTAQALLTDTNAVAREISNSLITDLEEASFSVSSLLSRSLIVDESQDITTSTSSARLTRKLASSSSSQSVVLSGSTLTVSIPDLGGKAFGTQQVAASDLLTSVITLSNQVPPLLGVEPLSSGIAISVSKGNSKTSLDVQGLDATNPVRFTISLTKPPPPPPPAGKQFRCESRTNS